MSLYCRGEPANNAQFRANTEKRIAQMVGVTTVPKRCKCVACGKMRTAVTGKETDDGFVCHACLTGRSK